MTEDRIPTADEWLDIAHREFRRESDRAAAIVIAAMLDDALKDLIEAKLVSPAQGGRSIVSGHDAPLGSFASRIDASYQLGLISRFMARDLHLVRKIRNEFAHRLSGGDFETAPIRDWVTALEKASDYNRRQPETRESVGPPGLRWDFLGLTAWMLYALRRADEDVEPTKPRGPEFGYIDWDALPPELTAVLDQNADE